MRTKTTLLAAALLIFAAVPCFADPASRINSSTNDAQAVAQASQQFYAALNTLFTGDAAPMSEIWSHAGDTTYMGPSGGFQLGWDQIRDNWEKQAALKLGGKVESSGVQITVGDNLATVQCYEVGDNVIDGKPQTVSIRATNTFRRENGEWKMIGHHTDLLPFLEKNTTTKANTTFTN